MCISKILIEAIDNGVVRGEANFDALFECARINKVEISFLKSVGKRDLLEKYLVRLGRIIRDVEEITSVLDGLDFTFYKLIKPVEYVPADIDILIRLEHVPLAIERLRMLGYRPIVWEKYTVTLTRNSVIVDLYIHPNISGSIIYLDGLKLLEHKITAFYHGIKIPSLDRRVEAVATASHALLKESIYTLNDYYVIREWVDKKSIELAEELKCSKVLRKALELNKLIGGGLLETPYKQPLSEWLGILLWKTVRDPCMRTTMLNTIAMLRDKRIGSLIANKLSRITY